MLFRIFHAQPPLSGVSWDARSHRPAWLCRDAVSPGPEGLGVSSQVENVEVLVERV
jgi:hypothetical protein